MVIVKILKLLVKLLLVLAKIPKYTTDAFIEMLYGYVQEAKSYGIKNDKQIMRYVQDQLFKDLPNLLQFKTLVKLIVYIAVKACKDLKHEDVDLWKS